MTLRGHGVAGAVNAANSDAQHQNFNARKISNLAIFPPRRDSNSDCISVTH